MSTLLVMPISRPPTVPEILAGAEASEAEITAALDELERAKAAAIEEIDDLSDRRRRLLVDAPDDLIDALDRELAAATRRLERLEARQVRLFERPGRPTAGRQGMQ